ncbi:MAG: hypothetical protein M3071_01645 [Actinomycetota bacterium]|nr:hypothetical protein [Actinomycetota bacterium]
MTVLPDLEQQLIRAAERATSPRQQQRQRQRIRAGARSAAGAVALATVVATTVAIVVGAVILLGGHKRSTSATPAPTGRQQLIAIIAALRRPQTKADLNVSILRPLERVSLLATLRGAPDLPLVRFATTTPWGEKLYFVPMKPPTAKQLENSYRGVHLPPAVAANLSARGETLSLFSSHGGGGGGDAASIEAGNAIEIDGAGRSFAGGSTETRFILVVPDGVAKVALVLPRQPQPGVPGAPTYRHSSTVIVAVHDNIMAVQVDREFDGGMPRMMWYSPDGHVLKRIGNFATINRIISPPKPGPETPLSLAAERNPSTPNPLWVTPAVGGPHTIFKLHFRLLLSGADYNYGLTGTHCPAITANGGDGGGGALGLRGRIWTDVVDAVSGQTWCPGTYHLSATVMDRGRSGMLKHPATPFGTATFTVRR